MKVLISLLVFSNLAFAQTEFRGNIKTTGKPCSLQIVQVYFANNIETPENLRADVKALLEDDHQVSNPEEFFFTIKPGPRANLFSGIADNQKDQLNVITKSGSVAFEALDLYAIKWWHTNHFHSAQCVNLTRVQE